MHGKVITHSFFIYKVRKRPQGMLKEKVESDEELVHWTSY